ncbi:hypothetical protein AWC19_06110 [Mycobacterium palustre]|uniref:Uncharacterized protein n=1 Tax=Mycobacterium palustre TaxID=153971 RepID=A0A1X1ZR72_9MYCO|nr:hypothetical protein AWC19_06110 [Mycobacterium palustre]
MTVTACAVGLLDTERRPACGSWVTELRYQLRAAGPRAAQRVGEQFRRRAAAVDADRRGPAPWPPAFGRNACINEPRDGNRHAQAIHRAAVALGFFEAGDLPKRVGA